MEAKSKWNLYKLKLRLKFDKESWSLIKAR